VSAVDFPLSLGSPGARAGKLRSALQPGRLLMAPGVFDCLTARLAECCGFSAVYMTGSGVSISRLGAPDVALLSFAEILDQAKRIADVTALPVIADADTGYGGPLNVIRTVREMERAGIAAIQIEDQDWPKRCGHELGRKLVSREEMVGRVKAAVDARIDPDLVIIARTDARTMDGLDAALERAHAYAEAGADIIFVESPESIDEMRRVTGELRVPTLANQVEGGRTPMLPAAELQEIGFGLAIYPNSITRLFGQMGQALFTELRESGSTRAFADRMLDHRALWELFEHRKFIEVEERYAVKKGGAGG
jgi:carboxyvinyl-carboxyphosphonate phosphorylmutase